MQSENRLVGLTLLGCFMCLFFVIFMANRAAKNELNAIIGNEEDTIQRRIPTLPDSFLTVWQKETLTMLEREVKYEKERYEKALKLYYPKHYILIWVTLLSTIIAAFLNLLAINHGWSNIGKPLKVALLFVIGVFMLANFGAPVLEYGKSAQRAHNGFVQTQSLVRDVHYYSQSGGHYYLDDGKTVWPKFLSYMYGRIEGMEKLGLLDGDRIMPSLKDMLKESAGMIPGSGTGGN